MGHYLHVNLSSHFPSSPYERQFIRNVISNSRSEENKRADRLFGLACSYLSIDGELMGLSLIRGGISALIGGVVVNRTVTSAKGGICFRLPLNARIGPSNGVSTPLDHSPLYGACKPSPRHSKREELARFNNRVWARGVFPLPYVGPARPMPDAYRGNVIDRTPVKPRASASPLSMPIRFPGLTLAGGTIIEGEAWIQHNKGVDRLPYVPTPEEQAEFDKREFHKPEKANGPKFGPGGKGSQHSTWLWRCEEKKRAHKAAYRAKRKIARQAK